MSDGKPLERSFQRIIEDQRLQRRKRSGIKQRLAYLVSNSRSQTGPEYDDIKLSNVRGKVLNSTKD